MSGANAGLLPNGKQQFCDANGAPLGAGTVAFYIPGTTTLKVTWKDPEQGTANTNPVNLDSAGEAIIYGFGQYRQVVKDKNGVLVWDQLTQDGISEATQVVDSFAAELANETNPAEGTALVGYFQSTSGWVGRTLQSKLLDQISVLDFGADPSGTADSSVGIQNALNASLNVYFPPGTYKISSAMSLQVGQEIWGAGAGNTIISIAGAVAGFQLINGAIGEAKILVRDLTLNGANASATGLEFTLCESVTVENVRFAGLQFNIVIDRGRWFLIDNCQSEGNSIYQSGQLKIWSSSDSDYCFYPVVRDYQVNTGLFDSGIVQGSASPAIYTRRTIQGRLRNCNIDHGEAGTPCQFILVENDTQGMKIVEGSSHGCTTGVLVQTGGGVQVGPGYMDIISHDVDLFSVAGIDINCNSPGVAVLVGIFGGKITGPGANGVPCIYISNLIDGSLVGVQCEDYSGNKYGTGLIIASDVTFNMSACIFDQLNRGLDFTLGSPVGCYFDNNSVTNCTTALIGAISGGSNRFSGNRGVNPITVTTPAVPASGTPIVNDTGSDVMVYLVGGTNVSASVGANALGANIGPYYLPANSTISLTYSVAPTWTWAGL